MFWLSGPIDGFSILIPTSDKCKVMSLGHSVHHDYCMTDLSGTRIMSRTSEERDLGIFITDTLKPSVQCTKAAARARSNPYSLWSEEISKDLTVKNSL